MIAIFQLDANGSASWTVAYHLLRTGLATAALAAINTRARRDMQMISSNFMGTTPWIAVFGVGKVFQTGDISGAGSRTSICILRVNG